MIEFVEPAQAGITTLGLVTLGLLVAARALLPRTKDNFKRDDTPTTTANRGAFVPLVIGRRRVGPIVTWDGSKFRKMATPGGGKGEEPERQVYHEPGMHVLGIGPMLELHGIYQNGEPLWEGSLKAPDIVDTIVEQDDRNNLFRVFWGSIDQPVSPTLSSPERLGVATRWPGYAYVEWDPKVLGGSPTWPQMEYEGTWGCPQNTLTRSEYWIKTPGNIGVNHAHALFQILTATYPWGVGIPPENIDNETLEELGILCEQEGLACNFVIKDGTEAKAAVEAILADICVVMPEVQHRLMFTPVRATTATVPQLTSSVTSPNPSAMSVRHGRRPSDQIVFSFLDEARNFKEMDIQRKDAGAIDTRRSYSFSKIAIDTVTNGTVAGRVATLREQLTLGDQVETSVEVLRGARLLMPGQILDYMGFRWRVLSKKLQSTRATLELALDVLSMDSDNNPYDQGGSGQSPAAAAVDTDVVWLPAPSNPSVVYVLRVRAHDGVSGAGVWVSSSSGGSYSLAGRQDTAAAGGSLLGALTIGSSPLEEGPVAEFEINDIASALNLSGDTDAWEAGRQLAVFVEGSTLEVCYLREVEAVEEAEWMPETAYSEGDFVAPDANPTGLRYECVSAGTSGEGEPSWPSVVGSEIEDGDATWIARPFTYQLKGLVRAQHGTSQAAFSAGADVYIVDAYALNEIQHPLIGSGRTVCIKTRPTTGSTTVDLATVTAVCDTIP